MLVANAGLAGEGVEVPALGVSATAIEPLEGVSATFNGVAGLAFFGGLPRFLPPTGRLLLISLRGGIILEEMKGNMGDFTPCLWLFFADDLKTLSSRAVWVDSGRGDVHPVVIARSSLGKLR